MDYLVLRERPRQFLDLPSLLPAEVDALLTYFAPAWERSHRYHPLAGAKRRLPAHAERANATRAGTDTKRFFLLKYLRINSLQQHQAASFGVSQTRVSRLATALLDVLNHVLHRRGLLPVRDGAELARHLAPHPKQVFAYDGITRGIPRNTDSAGQAAEYSAKKAHRLKNMTLCAHTQFVYFLSPGKAGGYTIKRWPTSTRCCRSAACCVRLWACWATRRPGSWGRYPTRSPRSGSSRLRRSSTTSCSAPCAWSWSTPTAVSNACAWSLIRYACAASGCVCAVMGVACGLHNLRVRSPHRAYLGHPPAIIQLSQTLAQSVGATTLAIIFLIMKDLCITSVLASNANRRSA